MALFILFFFLSSHIVAPTISLELIITRSPTRQAKKKIKIKNKNKIEENRLDLSSYSDLKEREEMCIHLCIEKKREKHGLEI
jgi:hypothetical protein